FAKKVRGRICTASQVSEVKRDRSGWQVTTKNGERRTYDTLVSTIPIHELLSAWPDAPKEARQAAARLRYNSLINVLLGLRGEGVPYTALYIPDPTIVFHRLSFPKYFSERNVPAGSWAIMVEIKANEGEA